MPGDSKKPVEDDPDFVEDPAALDDPLALPAFPEEDEPLAVPEDFEPFKDSISDFNPRTHADKVNRAIKKERDQVKHSGDLSDQEDNQNEPIGLPEDFEDRADLKAPAIMKLTTKEDKEDKEAQQEQEIENYEKYFDRSITHNAEALAGLSTAVDDFLIVEKAKKNPPLVKPSIYEILRKKMEDREEAAFKKLNKQDKVNKRDNMEAALLLLWKEAQNKNQAFSNLLKKYSNSIDNIRGQTKTRCDAIGVPVSRMPYITLLTCCLLFKAMEPEHPANASTGINTRRAIELAQIISSFKSSGGHLFWTSRVKKSEICQIVNDIFVPPQKDNTAEEKGQLLDSPGPRNP